MQAMVRINEETAFVDNFLFLNLCNDYMRMMLANSQHYYRLIKLNKNMESVMIEANFARFVINDILQSEEYTLGGIAFYTNTPEDALYDVAAGININPSLSLTKKIVDLHRSIKPALYQQLMRDGRVD